MSNEMAMLIFLAIVLYFCPSMSAIHRRKANWRAIVFLNVLLGWTFVGWVIAFTWALTVDKPEPTASDSLRQS